MVNDEAGKNSAMAKTNNTKDSLEGILNQLLDTLNDKVDETVKMAVQKALIKILAAESLQTTDVLQKYREKHPKLSQQFHLIILQVIEFVVTDESNHLENEAYERLVVMVSNELTKSNEHSPLIPNHAMTILVVIGTHNSCKLVVDELMGYAKEKTVPQHFMVMQCLGRLASSNMTGILPFIPSILNTILASLGNVRYDHIKQSYAYAIGRLSEALLEHGTSETALSNNGEEEKPPLEDDDTSVTVPASETELIIDCSTEISLAYDVLFNQWLNARDSKLNVEVLHALSSMFPLLPIEKINQDQSTRIIMQILALYRRSIERNSITEFLSSTLKTYFHLKIELSDGILDQIISQLFDLVCVYPDYEKPQTVKGHYEVLRCFHLLSTVYSTKIMETLLMYLRNNSERERIKSLLILIHLLNTSTKYIGHELYQFMDCLKQMINTEKTIKMKMTLLKMIVALAQKSFIKEREFVWFIVRYSCKYQRINHEHGTVEEHANFVLSCENSLFMLSSTVGTLDELLKRELLNYFVLFDYTDVCSNLAKCLASLFAKSTSIEYDVCTVDDGNATGTATETTTTTSQSNEENNAVKCHKIMVPTSDLIYSRCLALLGNYNCMARIKNILAFLLSYYTHINPKLEELWQKSIPDLLQHLETEKDYFMRLRSFISETNSVLKLQDKHFPDKLAKCMSDHMIMYPLQLPQTEFLVNQLDLERGMLLQAIALTVCYAEDVENIGDKIDLIITSARQEKLDKHMKHSDYEKRILSHTNALGYLARTHFGLLSLKLIQLMENATRKQTTGFFSNLNFIKDTQKELDNYKIQLLIVKSVQNIMDEGDPLEMITKLDENLLNYMINLLQNTKNQLLMTTLLRTLLNICQKLTAIDNEELTNNSAPAKYRKEIVEAAFNIPIEPPYDDLPLLPIILKLGTEFIHYDDKGHNEQQRTLIDGGVIFEIACKNFFSCAQHLRMKFESSEEDEHNSYLAKYLNESLPELCGLVNAILNVDPSPSTLDLIVSVLEVWMKDRNSEVRVCASQVFSNTLNVYIKTMRIGCEAPSKFNQTGQMLAQIVPRCLDSKGSVRQLSVDILQRTLEISCIYETLTIADPHSEWIEEISTIRESILNEDPKIIQGFAENIAKIIAIRISSFQYLQFCKNLLLGLKDPEPSSAIGAATVLKAFMQHRGSELFHAIPDLIKDSLTAIDECELNEAKLGVLRSLVVLTKHHPKLVSTELLQQPLPLAKNLIEFWQLVCTDAELSNTILDYFIQTLYSVNLYEPSEANEVMNSKRKPLANIQPLAVFCALHEMLPSPEIQELLKLKFADLFAILLTSLATYTNIPAPPTNNMNALVIAGYSSSSSSSGNSNQHHHHHNYHHHGKELYALLNPCQIVLETFNSFLRYLKMEQIMNALHIHNDLAMSTDLRNFIELLTPMAIGLSNEIDINSVCMKNVIMILSRYVSSPFDGQRIASIGFISRLIPLLLMNSHGDITHLIMNQLTIALSDPNPIVRGLSIQGIGYVNHLIENGLEVYTETAISSLLKGIDDANSDCLINTPLESLRGLSRILPVVRWKRIETFHVSLAIRIRPFLGSYSLEMREAAIQLFSDLCAADLPISDETDTTTTSNNNNMSDALREQFYANLFPLILHLSEAEETIKMSCKNALRRVCGLLNSPKVNEMAQRHLLDHGQLIYDSFVLTFVKLIAIEMKSHVQDFIDSCVPKLRSQWPEVRGSACIVIGILNNYLEERNANTDAVSQKIGNLLQDDNHSVRIKAANGLGYFYGGT